MHLSNKAVTGSIIADIRYDAKVLERWADEIEVALAANLAAWFPRCIDPPGGFHQNFATDWTELPDPTRFLVFQSRMTWVVATVTRRCPERSDAFRPWVAHGIRYLCEFWDRDSGGLFSRRVTRGDPLETHRKTGYDLAFALYAASAAARATGDPLALELASHLFEWLEEHARDAEHGGYHEDLDRSGRPRGFGMATVDGFRLQGAKTFNAHLHLLEALIEFVEAFPGHALARERLAEVLQVHLDHILLSPGVAGPLYAPDWRPLPGHNSPGHNLEAVFLLHEAERVLGTPVDGLGERLREIGEYTWHVGRVATTGGTVYQTDADGFVHRADYVWWAQVEAMNGWLVLAERFDEGRFLEAFSTQWAFVRDHQIDPTHGGLHDTVGTDLVPRVGRKGHEWKAAYHDTRAFLECAVRLRKLARSL